MEGHFVFKGPASASLKWPVTKDDIMKETYISVP